MEQRRGMPFRHDAVLLRERLIELRDAPDPAGIMPRLLHGLGDAELEALARELAPVAGGGT